MLILSARIFFSKFFGGKIKKFDRDLDSKKCEELEFLEKR